MQTSLDQCLGREPVVPRNQLHRPARVPVTLPPHSTQFRSSQMNQMKANIPGVNLDTYIDSRIQRPPPPAYLSAKGSLSNSAPSKSSNNLWTYSEQQKVPSSNTRQLQSNSISLPSYQTLKNRNSQTLNNPNSQTLNNPNSQILNNPNSQILNNPNSQILNNPNSQALNNINFQASNNMNSQALNNLNSHTLNKPNSQTLNKPNPQTLNNPNPQTSNSISDNTPAQQTPQDHSTLKMTILKIPEWIDKWESAEEVYIKSGLLPSYEEFLKKERPPIKKPKLLYKTTKDHVNLCSLQKTNYKVDDILRTALKDDEKNKPSTSEENKESSAKSPVLLLKSNLNGVKGNANNLNVSTDTLKKDNKNCSTPTEVNNVTEELITIDLCSTENDCEKTLNPLVPETTLSCHTPSVLSTPSLPERTTEPPRAILKLKPLSEILDESVKKKLQPVCSPPPQKTCNSLPDLSADSLNSQVLHASNSNSNRADTELKSNTLTIFSPSGTCNVLNKKEAHCIVQKVNRSLKDSDVRTLPSADFSPITKEKLTEGINGVKQQKKQNNSRINGNKFKEDKYGYLFDHKKYQEKYSQEPKGKKPSFESKTKKKNLKEKPSTLRKVDKNDGHNLKRPKKDSSVPSCSFTSSQNDFVSTQCDLIIPVDHKYKEIASERQLISYNKSLTNKNPKEISSHELKENGISKKNSYDYNILDLTKYSLNKARDIIINESVRTVMTGPLEKTYKKITEDTCKSDTKSKYHRELTCEAVRNPNGGSDNVLIIKKADISKIVDKSVKESKVTVNPTQFAPLDKEIPNSGLNYSNISPKCYDKYVRPYLKNSPEALEDTELNSSSQIKNSLELDQGKDAPNGNISENGSLLSKIDCPSSSLVTAGDIIESFVTNIHSSGICQLSQKLKNQRNVVNNTVLNEAKNDNDIIPKLNNTVIKKAVSKRKLEEFDMFKGVNIDKKAEASKKRKTDKYYLKKYKIKNWLTVDLVKLTPDEIARHCNQPEPLICEMEVDNYDSAVEDYDSAVEVNDIIEDNESIASIPNEVLSVPSVNCEVASKSLESLSPSRAQEVMKKYPFLKITNARKSIEGADKPINFIDKPNPTEANSNHWVLNKSKPFDDHENENIIKSPEHDEADRPWKITTAVSLSSQMKISFPKNSLPLVSEQHVTIRDTHCDFQDKMIVSTVGKRNVVANSLSDPRFEKPTYCGFSCEHMSLLSADRSNPRITAVQRYIREAVAFKSTSFEEYKCCKCQESFKCWSTWSAHVRDCK